MLKKLTVTKKDYIAISYFSYHSAPAHIGRVDSIFLMHECTQRILKWWADEARDYIRELITGAADFTGAAQGTSILLQDISVVPPNFHRRNPRSWYTIRIALQEDLGDPRFRLTVKLRIPAASVQDETIDLLEITHISAEHDLMNGSVVLWEDGSL